MPTIWTAPRVVSPRQSLNGSVNAHPDLLRKPETTAPRPMACKFAKPLRGHEGGTSLLNTMTYDR